MSAEISRRLLLGTGGAAMLLWLTGCAGTDVPAEDPAAPATFTNIGPRAKPASPRVRSIVMPTVDAFKGDGLWYFDDDSGAQFRITDSIRKNNRYPVVENYSFGKPHGFSWGAGAVGVLRRGRRMPPEVPSGLRPERDHVVIEFDNDQGLELHVALEAYDVSGEEIRDYLRNRLNMPSNAALFMGEEKFPAGSIAYAATLWVEQDELLAASASAFTGSDTIEAFSKRFTNETPYCLRVLPGENVTPLGLRFEAPIVKKMVRKNKQSRPVEAEQKGKVHVYRTKKGTIFCNKAEEAPIAQADWHLRRVNGTRTLTLTFPRSTDPLSIGLLTHNRGKILTAFAEEVVPEENDRRKVIPAGLWLKNAKIRDAQYRFNKTAAEAIEAAIRTARPKRAAWEKANESDVTRRARALQARKEQAAAAKRTPSKKKPAARPKAKAKPTAAK